MSEVTTTGPCHIGTFYTNEHPSNGALWKRTTFTSRGATSFDISQMEKSAL